MNFEEYFNKKDKQPHEMYLLEYFQVYISKKYYWYSPPCKNILGYHCIPLNDIEPLKDDLLDFIKMNFDLTQWDNNYQKSNHWRLNYETKE